MLGNHGLYISMNAKPITVLDLRDSPWVDGPGRTILDCAEDLRKDGINVVIGAFSGGAQKTSAYVDEAMKRGLETLVIPETSALDKRVPGFIARAIDEIKADIVHTHDFRSNLFGLVCARRKKVPVISTVHGWIANGWKGRVYTTIDRYLLRWFDNVISVSDRTAQLVADAGVSPSKIAVINNALRLDTYRIDRASSPFRNEIGVSADGILIGNIGRLSPEKGQLEFLKAGLAIVRRHGHVRLVLVGRGPDEAKLREFVIRNGVQDQVLFCGYRTDMENIYNGLDLIVQSSHTEGMPNVMLEALLMKVPVIATNVGGTSEIVRHMSTGVLVPPGDVEALAQAMEQAIACPDAAKAMIDRGFKLIVDQFDHQKRVALLGQIYRQLMQRSVPGP